MSLILKVYKSNSAHLFSFSSHGTKRIKLIKEDDTRCNISCPVEHFPHCPLTLALVLA